MIGSYPVGQSMGGDETLAQMARWRHSTLDNWQRSPETEELWQMMQMCCAGAMPTRSGIAEPLRTIRQSNFGGRFVE